jgi:hypothetical protein
MRARDLIQRLEDKPFKPFRVHLSDGTILAVPEHWMVVVGDTTAIIPSKYGRDEDGYRIAKRWRTVDLLHIVQFSDMGDRANGRRHRPGRR